MKGNIPKERTLATSSPILTNGSTFFIRELNDVIKSCWFDRVSDVLVRASEMRGCDKFCVDVWACSSALPATADVESRVIRTVSLAALWSPFLLTKDRTTSKLWRFNVNMINKLNVTCLRSVANLDVQVDPLARCQSCQGTYQLATREAGRVV